METARIPLDLPKRNILALQEALAKVRSPRLADFIRYMIAIHPADRLPGRHDFDPLQISALLAGVVLVSVHRLEDRIRFQMKVVGQDVADASPVRTKDRFLDEVVTELPGANIIVDSRMKVLETGHAYLRQGPPTMPFTFKMTVLEYIHCPLASDGETIDQIVSCFSYRGQEHLIPVAE